MSKRQQSDPADLWVVGGKWEKDRSVATFRSYYEFCPQCGWWLTGRFSICPSCGADLKLKLCPYCRGMVPANEKNCHRCSAPLE